MKFRWRQTYGFNSSAVDAETFAEVVGKLPERTPAAVVEAGRSKRSKIHFLFTWDDSDAAERWRLREAGQALVACVRVETSGDEHREYVYVPEAKDEEDEVGSFKRHAELGAQQKERVRARLRSLVAQARESLREFERMVGSSAMIQAAGAALDVVERVVA